MELEKKNNSNILYLALLTVVFGSVWGITELVLGGFLHAIHLPHKGAVMGGFAISLMAMFIAATGKPLLVPLLGVIAASFKPFSALLFGMPVMSPFVINPAVAIIMQALAVGAVLVVMKRMAGQHILARAGSGFAAGFLGFSLYGLTASVAGMGIWPTLDVASRLNLVWTSAIPIGMAGAVMMVIGSYLGRAGALRLSAFRMLHPRVFYPASFSLILLCWVTTVFI